MNVFQVNPKYRSRRMSHLKKHLLPALHEAHEIASNYKGGWSDEFGSSEEFCAALKIAIARFEAGDTSQVDNLARWFVIAGDWDNLIGEQSLFIEDLFRKL
jgi:hypothetical protein